jgi:acetyl esterase
MAALLDGIERAGRPPFHRMLPAAARAAYQQGAEVLDLPRAAVHAVRDIRVPGGHGAMLAARWYRPVAQTRGTLLYLHGGGFTIGNLETHDSLCRQLALHSGADVVALDYRLAPEHRFPAAVDDAWTAMQFIAREGDSLGLDGTRLAVGGDSAGGTLAAVSALHARDTGLSLRLQLLITPGTGALADTPSHRKFAEGYLLDAESIEWFFAHYLDAEQRHDWRFAPLKAEHVDGVAPAFVLLAECDPLVDEGVAYADRLRWAGVPVELDLVRGVTHDFIKMGRSLEQARVAHADAGRALREAFET